MTMGSVNVENLHLGRLRYRDSAAHRGRTRVCGMHAFYNTYLSGWQRPPDKDLDTLVDTLKKNRTIKGRPSHWADLECLTKLHEESTAKSRSANEDAHFARLEKVVEKILSTAERIFPERFSSDKRTTQFMCRPLKTTASEVQGSSHRIDAIFVRKNSSYPRALPGGVVSQDGRMYVDGKVLTADLTDTGEFKLGITDKDIIDNEMKTFGHAGHAFYNDVGRAAVLSFTIERTFMRIWYHTRSHTGVCRVFDMNKEPHWFVLFVLANTYAPLSVLGFDPTVRRVLDIGGRLQYQFDIYNAESAKCTTYQTTRVLDDSSAIELYSRAMRVFEVNLVLKNAALAKDRMLSCIPEVLRDYWVYSDVKDEGKIQRDITGRLEKLPGWDDIRDHFMGIEEDGMVRYPPAASESPSSVPRPPDVNKVYEFLHHENPKNDGPSKKILEASAEVRTVEARDGVATPAPQAAGDPLLNLHAKKHCRTVYKQLCIDLYKVCKPALYFHALSQVVKILCYLKRALYLHRDVSPGNFLLHHSSGGLELPLRFTAADLEQWITLVSDLEYARPYDGGTGHDPLTGTPHFIAIEVQAQMHSFLPQAGNKIDFTRPDVHPASKCFAYNYYHDLESALWMALHFAFRKMPKSKVGTLTSGVPTEALLNRHASELFVDDLRGSATRAKCLEKEQQMLMLAQTLVAIYGRESPMLKILELLIEMRDAYRRLEDSEDIPLKKLDNGRQIFKDHLFLDDIYHKMEATFREISNAYLGDAEEYVWVPTPPKKEEEPVRFTSVPPAAPAAPARRRSQRGRAPVVQASTSTDHDEMHVDDSRPVTPTLVAPRSGRGKKATRASAEDAPAPSLGSRKRTASNAGAEPPAPAKRSRTTARSGTRQSARIQAQKTKSAELEAAKQRTRESARAKKS